MKLKDLLVHLQPGVDPLGAAESFALELANAFGAHLTAAGLAILYTSGNAIDVGFGAWAVEMAQKSRAEAEASYLRLQAAAPAGVSTELVVLECADTTASHEMSRLARHFDLLIVGQGEPGEEDRWVATAALLGSGRPVMMIPNGYKKTPSFQRAMICWDGGLPAARALASSMPLLARTTEVEILTVAAGVEAEREKLPGFNIARHLARHGIPTTLKKLPPTNRIAASLLSRADESGADYMVMGGYGHSRLSEFVLGGTTRSAFGSMEIPIIMAH